MMFTDGLYLSLTTILLSYLALTQAADPLLNNPTNNSMSTVNTTINGNATVMTTSMKNRIDQSKEIIHDVFANMDRGTLIRGTIVLAGITCLVLMYIGIKAFVLRKKRQPKRYTLITNPTAMEEPLFGANDDEEEMEDDTLFVRK